MTEQFVGLYKIILVSTVLVLFELLEYLRIYSVVNMSRIIIYKKLVEKKKKILYYLIEIERVNEYKIGKIKVYIKKKPKRIIAVKGLYSRKEYIREIRKPRKYKRDSRRIWKEI